MANVRIVVAQGDSRLELEGNQSFVAAHLKKLLPVVTGALVAPEKVKHSEHSDTPKRLSGGQTRQSLATFVESKNPQNAYEAIAVVLYHRRKTEGKEELSGPEIRAALVQGRYRPPDSSMAQTLTDCRRKYGYIQAGSKKGLWRLSHTGETTVEFDLPHKET